MIFSRFINSLDWCSDMSATDVLASNISVTDISDTEKLKGGRFYLFYDPKIITYVTLSLQMKNFIVKYRCKLLTSFAIAYNRDWPTLKTLKRL